MAKKTSHQELTTIESLIRKRAIGAGYRVVRIWESGSPRGDYTLLNSRGYTVISPVSIEEIDRFLSEQSANADNGDNSVTT
jgi:hypothetical protein